MTDQPNNHGLHVYKGDEFPEYRGMEIEVRDDHSDAKNPCYEIRFTNENYWHGNMSDDDISWQKGASMSSKPTITDMNRDLTKFVDLYEISSEENEFNADYNLLMMAFKKFEVVGDELKRGKHWIVFVIHWSNMRSSIVDEPITEAHRLIWEGVKWYNEIKK